ncbi:hypothetical protein [Candidatus Poriferisodalis sp.]|uniref:hypothetical protein n=1 Tax=Candidatus Poriferisodalis sp. TaxID=3101277 RepID=UPI003B01C643
MAAFGVLAIVGVLLVHDARPAEAALESPLWQATMTPNEWRGTSLAVVGCSNAAGNEDCSTTASTTNRLSDDDFVIDGTTYTITKLMYIVYDGGSPTPDVRLDIDPVAPVTQLQNYVLTDGSQTLPLGSCQRHSTKHERFVCASVGSFSLTAGSAVTLRLIPKPPAAPTGLSLAPGPRADTIAAAWTAPDTMSTARVTGYEVRYKEVHAPNAAAAVAGDPLTGWVTVRVGTTPRAILDAEYALRREYYGQVRALSASGASPWSAQAQGAPKDPPGGPAATPLRLLSASRTSVTEGATVTVTARLRVAVESAVSIPLVVEGTAGAGDYTLSSPAVAIAAGQRSGSVTLTVVDDSDAEGAEIIYITPDIGAVRNEAVPDSGAVAYQVAALRIDIAASDQPAPAAPAGVPPAVGATVGGADPGIPSGTRSTYDADNSGVIDRSELVKAARKLAEGEIDIEEYQHVAICVLRPADCN